MTGWPLFLALFAAMFIAGAAYAVWSITRPPKPRPQRVPRSTLTVPPQAAQAVPAALPSAPEAPAPRAPPPVPPRRPPRPSQWLPSSPLDRNRPPPVTRSPRRQAAPRATKDNPAYKWRIAYTDFEGNDSTRVILVTQVRDRRRQVEAWCTQREAMRTFNLDNCRLIEDIYNGEVIVDLTQQPPIDNLEEWLRRYRSERRQR